MIPIVNPIPEPISFHIRCRQRGIAWLTANPGSSSFPAFWREFQTDLDNAFAGRCGWWAMRIAEGTVDHYLSKEKYRLLAYEWSNYRFAAGSLNSSKQNLDDQVLDPFEVQHGWFQVILPSMQLIRTEHVPIVLRGKVDFTIKRLKLDNGVKVRKNRQRWYEDYKLCKISFDGLSDFAPLVADAVSRWPISIRPLP